MYEIFQKLLEERGIRPADITKATGIASSTLTDWKAGRSKPKSDKLQLIADYFGVSIDYLMTGKEQKDEFTEYQDQAELLITIRHDKKMLTALEKFYKLSARQKEHVFELIELLEELRK